MDSLSSPADSFQSAVEGHDDACNDKSSFKDDDDKLNAKRMDVYPALQKNSSIPPNLRGVEPVGIDATRTVNWAKQTGEDEEILEKEISVPRLQRREKMATVDPSGDGNGKNLGMGSPRRRNSLSTYDTLPNDTKRPSLGDKHNSISAFLNNTRRTSVGDKPKGISTNSLFGEKGRSSVKFRSTFGQSFKRGDHALLFVDPYLPNNRPSWTGDFCLVNRIGFQNGKGIMADELAPPFRYVLCQILRVSQNFNASSLTVTVEGEASNSSSINTLDNSIYRCVRLDTQETVEVKIAEHLVKINMGSAGFRMAKNAAKSGHQLVSKKKDLHEARLLAAKNAEENGKRKPLLARFFKTKRRANLNPFFSRRHLFSTLTYRQRFSFFIAACFKRLQLWMLNFRLHIFYIQNGVPPYNIELKLTRNTCLWVCSLWFPIADLVKFCNSEKTDKMFNDITCAVWFILVFDLFSEILIRPMDYSKLLRSNKAFYPSTQRYIDNFHFFLEFLALALYFPEILLYFSDNVKFGIFHSYMNTLDSAEDSNPWLHIIWLALVHLRIVGVMRRWRQSTINASYLKTGEELSLAKVPDETNVGSSSEEDQVPRRGSCSIEDSHVHSDTNHETPKLFQSSAGRYYTDNEDITRASTIQTALMVTNSHLIIVVMLLLCTSVHIIFGFRQDTCAHNMASYLLKINIEAGTKDDNATCYLLENSLNSWEKSFKVGGCYPNKSYLQTYNDYDSYLMWVELLPKRKNCTGKGVGGVFFSLLNDTSVFSDDTLIYDLAVNENIREAAINNIERKEGIYSVRLKLNETPRLQHFILYFFILQIVLLIATLWISWRLEADTLQNVLVPLFSLLEIVSLYASNPLATVISGRKKGRTSKRKGSVGSTGSTSGNSSVGSSSDDDSIVDKNETELGKVGKYETDRLINTITKITSMLRQCWGVAGASIISSTLGTTDQHVFNPVVPGRKVHAIFGFVGIGDWSYLLRTLNKDVMILINDIANVVHTEVYRWGLYGLGQCNKNLGPAFLMVFKIGNDKEVREKKKLATEVIFENNFDPRKQRWHDRTQSSNTILRLEDLPGIHEFSDRAAIGMLKAFASVYRNSNILQFTEDFQLQKDGRPFHTRITFGMDAGYAMEGAVGSKYKVDATYLSPHVNMAARMMSACKQFGVFLLCSEAFRNLLSPQAKEKFRHIDTCTVKGSSKKQRVFTYDARHLSINFFLHVESQDYSPEIWKTDQDLKAMRRHITPEFEAKFNAGRNLYLNSNWKAAIKVLKEADELMFHGMEESGALDEEIELINKMQVGSDMSIMNEAIKSLRSEMGDGPSKCLIKYMLARNAIPPLKFREESCRALDSK